MDQERSTVTGIWPEAIKANNLPFIQAKLDDLSYDEIEKVFNTPFPQDPEPPLSLYLDTSDTPFRITLPWTLAVVYGSYDVMDCFIRQGCDVTMADCHGMNVVHVLVKMAAMDEDKEEDLVEIYRHLVLSLSPDSVRVLLTAEDGAGFRPLELSAVLSTFQFFLAIFQTRGVYLVREELWGQYQKLQYYDVTEYEGDEEGSRSNKSPLLNLSFIDNSHLTRATQSGIFSHGPLVCWGRSRFSTVKHLIVITACSRVLIIVLFYLLDITSPPPSHTSRPPNHTCTGTGYHGNIQSPVVDVMSLLLLLLSLITLVWECYILIAVSLSLSPRRGLRSLLVFIVRGCWCKTTPYFINALMEITLSVLIIVKVVLTQLHRFHVLPVSLSLHHLLYITIIFLFLTTMSSFVVLVPWIGCFSATINHMTSVLLQFLLFYLLGLVTFTMAFRVLLLDESVCILDFTSPLSSFYSTFTIMLNIVNFHDYELEDPLSVHLLHFVFVFLVQILLVNFLIALFSQSVSHVNENTDAIQFIPWMTASYAATLGHGCAACYYKTGIKRYFHCDNNKIYVIVSYLEAGKPNKS